MKLNDIVKMNDDTIWWKKGDIGRIVRKGPGNSYLICFDRNCTQEHHPWADHTWFARKEAFELYRPNKLMKVE